MFLRNRGSLASNASCRVAGSAAWAHGSESEQILNATRAEYAELCINHDASIVRTTTKCKIAIMLENVIENSKMIYNAL